MGTRYKMFLFTYFSVIFLKLSYCLSSEEEEQIKIEWIMSIRFLLITCNLKLLVLLQVLWMQKQKPAQATM